MSVKEKVEYLTPPMMFRDEAAALALPEQSELILEVTYSGVVAGYLVLPESINDGALKNRRGREAIYHIAANIGDSMRAFNRKQINCKFRLVSRVEFPTVPVYVVSSIHDFCDKFGIIDSINDKESTWARPREFFKRMGNDELLLGTVVKAIYKPNTLRLVKVGNRELAA